MVQDFSKSVGQSRSKYLGCWSPIHLNKQTLQSLQQAVWTLRSVQVVMTILVIVHSIWLPQDQLLHLLRYRHDFLWYDNPIDQSLRRSSCVSHLPREMPKPSFTETTGWGILQEAEKPNRPDGEAWHRQFGSICLLPRWRWLFRKYRWPLHASFRQNGQLFPTQQERARQELLSKIAKEVPVVVVTYVDAHRGSPSKKIMTQDEKEATAKKRKEEGDTVVDARIDAALAIQ